MATSWQPPDASGWEAPDQDKPSWETSAWDAPTLVQCVSLRPWLKIPGEDEPGGCHDLTLGRLYERIGVEADGAFYRIIDDSDDDFLYPASHFRLV